MLDNFIESTIRRLNIRTLLISLAGLLVVFAGLAINTRYLYNMFLGPFPLERNKLLTLGNAGIYSNTTSPCKVMIMATPASPMSTPPIRERKR